MAIPELLETKTHQIIDEVTKEFKDLPFVVCTKFKNRVYCSEADDGKKKPVVYEELPFSVYVDGIFTADGHLIYKGKGYSVQVGDTVETESRSLFRIKVLKEGEDLILLYSRRGEKLKVQLGKVGKFDSIAQWESIINSDLFRRVMSGTIADMVYESENLYYSFKSEAFINNVERWVNPPQNEVRAPEGWKDSYGIMSFSGNKVKIVSESGYKYDEAVKKVKEVCKGMAKAVGAEPFYDKNSYNCLSAVIEYGKEKHTWEIIPMEVLLNIAEERKA